MSEATTTEKGLQLPCPRCGEPNANMLLHLANGESFTCQECDEELVADELADLLARWAPVLAWLDLMPKGGA